MTAPQIPAESHVLYRHYNADGILLYVGITNSPAKRLGNHRSNAGWWAEVANGGYSRYETFDSRAALTLAEEKAIQSERPRDNVRRYDTPNPKPRRSHRRTKRLPVLKQTPTTVYAKARRQDTQKLARDANVAARRAMRQTA